MIAVAAVAATPVDDFLAGSRTSATGERLEAIGAGLGLAGSVLAVGLVVFAAFVHRGSQSEVRALLSWAMAGGAMMAVGGVVELTGTAEVLDLGVSDVVTDGSSASAMLRLLGGLLVLFGLGDRSATIPSDRNGSVGLRRWSCDAASSFGLVGAVLAVLSFSFDGHTVSEGHRLVHAAVNVVHVGAASGWFGGVVALAVVAWMRRRSGSVDDLLVGFSTVATVSLVAVFAAGAASTWMIIDSWSQVTSTEWGRRLVVKVVGVGVAAVLGAYHHLVVVPRADSGQGTASSATRRTLTVEAVVLAAVVVLSAVVTRSSIV